MNVCIDIVWCRYLDGTKSGRHQDSMSERLWQVHRGEVWHSDFGCLVGEWHTIVRRVDFGRPRSSCHCAVH